MKRWWIAVAAAAALHAGSPLTVDGNRVRVRDGKLTLHLPRTIHGDGGAGGVDPRESTETVHAALAAAARAWTSGPFASVGVQVDVAEISAPVGRQNSVTFTEPRPFDSGVCDPETFVACAVLTVTAAGEVEGFDIAFNPAFRHSSIGLARAYPIAPAMLHEIGHVLGLDHSAVVSAAMSPFAESAGRTGGPSFGYGSPTEDDLLTLAETYPAANSEPRLARISGRVTQRGTPLAGAHVVAIRETGLVARGGISREDGSYSFPVEPGGYRLAAEPLDGPIVPGRFVASIPTGPAFPTVFIGLVTAEGGATAAADIDVPEGPVCDLPWVAIPDASGRFVSADHVTAARDGSTDLVLRGAPGAGVPTVTASAASVVPEDAPVPIDVPGIPGVLLQLLGIRGEAPVGPVAVVYHDGACAAMLAGGLRIVRRPRVDSIHRAEGEAGIAEGFRAGERFILRGTDLGSGETAPEPTAGQPRPAYLGVGSPGTELEFAL